MGKPQYLFGVPANSQELNDMLVVGVSSGSHVAHLLSPNENGQEISEEVGNETDRLYTQDVTQAEVFSNASDLKTKEKFIATAKYIAKEYEENYANEEYKNYLISVKNYLTAKTHQAQQNALKQIDLAYKKNVAKHSALEEEFNKIPDDDPKAMELGDKLNSSVLCTQAMDNIAQMVLSETKGNLEVPKEEMEYMKSQKITEPDGNNFFDKGGFWQKSSKELFPHEPSPNDIKQGVGIQDCFLLSALVQMAEKNPQNIKDRMKDNEDGTVTVKFNDKNNGNKPVYVTVNKTVKQDAFGNNYYAASSLWVQMIEKAYVKFREQTNVASKGHTDITEKGFAKINRGESDQFLNAFDDKEYGTTNTKLPYNESMMKYINREPNSLPKNYMREERDMINTLKHGIEERGDIVTVGISPYNMNNVDYKSVGIRPGHAYTVRKFVTRNVDGVEKTFVQLRDPYASFKMGYNEEGLFENRSHEVKGFFNAGTDNMGTFEMEFRDFALTFDSYSGIPNQLYNEMMDIKFRSFGGKNTPTVEEIIADKIEDKNLDGTIRPDKSTNERYKEAEESLKNMKGFGAQPEPEPEQEPEPEPEGFAWKDVQRKQIENRLSEKNSFLDLRNKLADAYKELKSTDEWFVWTNTSKFNELRNNLKELNDMMSSCMKKTKNGEVFTQPDAIKSRQIAEKMQKVNALSINYIVLLIDNVL